MTTHQSFTRTVMFIALAFLITGGGAIAQDFSLWGDLEPGPHGVGFETIEQYDYSRTFRSPTDYFGNPQEGQTARPIQACIWYPAQKADGQIAMVYGEYAFPYPADDEFFNLVTIMQNRELGVLGMILGGNANTLKAMDLSMMAVRDADWAEGPFPTIVFHPSFRGAYCQNVVLCEYLASHGFVVVTTHALGTRVADAGPNLQDLETSVRDKEFAAGLLKQRPGADLTRIGVLGGAIGGLGALIHQMRNPGVAAVAIMQGDFAPDAAPTEGPANPSLAPIAASKPILHIHVEGAPGDNHGYIDELIYAENHQVQLDGPTAMGLTTYGLLSLLVRDSTGPSPDLMRNTYEATCAAVNSFFKTHVERSRKTDALEHGPNFIQNSMETFANMVTPPIVSHRPGDPLPPTRVQFMGIIRENADVAVELAEKFDLCNPELPIMPGPNFTGLGYGHLQSGRTESALKIFNMGVTAFPNSANGWDSYGEACSAAGDLHMAVTCYEKALSLLDTDTNINPGLKEMIATNIPPIIVRLKERIAEQESDK